MNPARRWQPAHLYAVHAAAFLLMLAAPSLMVQLAQHAAPGWTYPPPALFTLTNLLELFIQ
jgi:hypothetical protein